METKNLWIIGLYIKKLFNWKNLLLFLFVGILCFIFQDLLVTFSKKISPSTNGLPKNYNALIIETYIIFVYLNFIFFYSIVYLWKIRINNDKYFFIIFIFIFIFYLLIIVLASVYLYSYSQYAGYIARTENFRYLYPKVVALNILALFTILLINNKNYIFYYFLLLIQIWFIFNYFVHMLSASFEWSNVDFMLGIILSIDAFLIVFNILNYYQKKYINLFKSSRYKKFLFHLIFLSTLNTK